MCECYKGGGIYYYGGALVLGLRIQVVVSRSIVGGKNVDGEIVHLSQLQSPLLAVNKGAFTSIIFDIRRIAGITQSSKPPSCRIIMHSSTVGCKQTREKRAGNGITAKSNVVYFLQQTQNNPSKHREPVKLLRFRL